MCYGRTTYYSSESSTSDFTERESGTNGTCCSKQGAASVPLFKTGVVERVEIVTNEKGKLMAKRGERGERECICARLSLLHANDVSLVADIVITKSDVESSGQVSIMC